MFETDHQRKARSCAADVLPAGAWLAAFVFASACERAPAVDPGQEPTGEAVESASAPQEAESLEGAPRPDVLADDAACTSDAECRAWQPSDWNADAECCYVYGCALDYEALHVSSRDRLRAWERANPFDCVEHLREHGPCAPRGPVCGVSQDPPEAVCREGRCALEFPRPWPRVEPEAQTCATSSECALWRPSTGDLDTLCCDTGDCSRTYVPVNHGTLRELEAWLELRRTECSGWSETHTCEVRSCAPHAAPRPVCQAGLCRLDGA